jgi:hypothetical protein
MDWAGNDLSNYHGEFDSFDEAECGEYVITEKGE